MHPPAEQTPVRIRRLAPGESPETWRRAFREALAGSGESLKREADRRVIAVSVDGRTAVVKIGPVGPLDRVRGLLGVSREDRHWEGARLVESAGVRAARPLALARSGSWSLLALEHVPGPTLLSRLAEAHPPREDLALARSIGAAAGRLARAGLVNRDAKPSNWIVGQPPAMIDTVGIRRSVSRNRRARMLASLMIEALGVGVAVRRSPAWAAVRAFALELGGGRGEAKRWWRDAARIIADHGDPRPRINPLR